MYQALTSLAERAHAIQGLRSVGHGGAVIAGGWEVDPGWDKDDDHMGLSTVMGVPQARWMVFARANPTKSG